MCIIEISADYKYINLTKHINMLRKVKYCRKSEFYALAFASSKTDLNYIEATKVRDGYFHLWTGSHFGENNLALNVMGLIEDVETGKMESVDAVNITFLEKLHNESFTHDVPEKTLSNVDNLSN